MQDIDQNYMSAYLFFLSILLPFFVNYIIYCLIFIIEFKSDLKLKLEPNSNYTNDT